MTHKLFYFALISPLFLFIQSCNNHKQDQPTSENYIPIVIKKDRPQAKNDSSFNQAPIINIEESIETPYLVLCVKDSAANSKRLGEKLASIFGRQLPEAAKKYKLKLVGPPIAWYKTTKAPFFFEAGFPIDKKAAKPLKEFSYKILGKDSVVLAHYFGPYEETAQAYEALKDWLKAHHKKNVAPPYEIYIDDPLDKKGKPLDPYKLKTDIVFPY